MNQIAKDQQLIDVEISKYPNTDAIGISFRRDLLYELFDWYVSENDLQVICLEYGKSMSHYMKDIKNSRLIMRFLQDNYDVIWSYNTSTNTNYPSIVFDQASNSFLLVVLSESHWSFWSEVIPQLMAIRSYHLKRPINFQLHWLCYKRWIDVTNGYYLAERFNLLPI